MKHLHNSIHFIDQLIEFKVCGQTIYQMSGKSFQLPSSFNKILNANHNLDNCSDCKTNFEETLQGFEKKLELFPLCCDHHKPIIGQPWFNKSDFKNAPRLAAEKIFFTKHFILKYFDELNWKEEITDYIYYIVHTFGSLPYGEPLFLGAYFNHLRKFLTDLNGEQYLSKKEAILEYIDNLNSIDPNKSETDLNILLGIYDKWFYTFPFDMSIFSGIKQKFSKGFPILEKTHYNKYLQVSIATPKTKKDFLSFLEYLTEKIVTEIASADLYEKGEISDLDSYHLELLHQNRKLKLKMGYINKSSDPEIRYRKVLKEWLHDELNYIKEFSELLKSKEDKVCNIYQDVLLACGKMQQNKMFWTADENARTRQILDLLSSSYFTKDQSHYGESSEGKKPGSVDGIIFNNKGEEHFIEALNVDSLEKEKIIVHINKLEKSYDSKGQKKKFLIAYLNIPDGSVEEFHTKYIDYINNEIQFEYQRIDTQLIESPYTDQRIIRTKHLRESKEVVIYHILLKMPKPKKKQIVQ